MAFFSCWTKFWLSWVALFSLFCSYSLSSRSFQSKVDTEVCVMGGNGGCTIRHTWTWCTASWHWKWSVSYLWRRCRGPDRGAWHGWHGGHRGETTGWCSPSNSRRRGATTTTFHLEGAEDTVQTIRFAIFWNMDDGPIKFSQFPPVPGWDPPPPWPPPAWPRCSRAPGRGGQGSKESWELTRQECKAYKHTISQQKACTQSRSMLLPIGCNLFLVNLSIGVLWVSSW